MLYKIACLPKNDKVIKEALTTNAMCDLDWILEQYRYFSFLLQKAL